MLKKYLIVFLVSMVPLIELRGSIPIGLGMGLNPLWLYIICIVYYIEFYSTRFGYRPSADGDIIYG